MRVRHGADRDRLAQVDRVGGSWQTLQRPNISVVKFWNASIGSGQGPKGTASLDKMGATLEKTTFNFEN